MTTIKVNEYSLNCLCFKTYDNELGFPSDSVPCICSINAGLDPYVAEWVCEALGYPQTPIFYLSCFGTNSNFRGMGYGRQMLKYIKQYFRGCVLYLEVSSLGEMSNQQLKAFYESEGFHEICPKDGYPMYYTMAIKL